MITLYHGKNVYESWNAFNGARKKSQQNSLIALKVIDGDEASSITDLVSASVMPGLFATKNASFIKRIFKNRSKKLLEELAEYILKTNDDIYIWEDSEVDKRLKLYKNIVKVGSVIDSKFLSASQLIFWLRKICEDNGIKATDKTLHFLVQRVGAEQFSLESEIKKLFAYVKSENRTDLAEKDIELLCVQNSEEDIWEMIDSVTQKNHARAISLIDNLLSTTEGYQLFLGMLVRQFKILLQVNLESHLSEYEISSKLGLHPFVVKKIYNIAKQMSKEKLAKVFQKLLGLDKKVKEGLIDPKLGINLFIFSL